VFLLMPHTLAALRTLSPPISAWVKSFQRRGSAGGQGRLPTMRCKSVNEYGNDSGAHRETSPRAQAASHWSGNAGSSAAAAGTRAPLSQAGSAVRDEAWISAGG
jgi:hypothetical protein